jgi:3-oxoacyl-[acyl-carrier-protein] synthase II
LKDARVPKERVNYINAHATSTLAGDLCEIRAIQTVFGPHAKQIKINATKSMIGHCLGAAGGLEAVAVVKQIQTGMLHPTINLDHPEPATEGLDLVPNHAKAHSIEVALSNSFGFGGHNSTLVFGPYKK